MKDYLLSENERNHRNHPLYQRLMKLALGECDVLVAHHLTFTFANEEPNEIPSADTLIFDLDLMSKVFGTQAQDIMAHLAQLGVDARDALLEVYVEEAERGRADVSRLETHRVSG